LIRFVKSMLTLSPLMFIFQGKIIGHYVVNELRYGGATYVSTGRGLPTDRRPFIGEAQDSGLKLKKVGGLYLDYALITYYDGVKLLSGLLLILMAGGVSNAGSSASMLAWVFLSLGLVISSWLLAPFIFNPYQFQLTAFCQDLRCTAAFFLEESGRHWVEWYDRTQLKRGSGRSAVDITFFIAAVLIVAWYAMINVKVAALSRIYFVDSAEGLNLSAVMLIPPFIFSGLYCIIVSVVESNGGVYNVMRRSRLRAPRLPKRVSRFATELPWQKSSGSEGSDEVEDEPVAHVTETDRPVQPALPAPQVSASNEASSKRCCIFGLPLAISALVVVSTDFIEAFLSLYRLYHIGWSNALLAALVLKMGIIALFLQIGEGILRKQWGPRVSRLVVPLDLWVRAHRIARDMASAFVILASLMPLVLLNKLNDCLCPGLSLHHLLMYRNPNHLMKKEVDLEQQFDQAEEAV